MAKGVKADDRFEELLDDAKVEPKVEEA